MLVGCTSNALKQRINQCNPCKFSNQRPSAEYIYGDRTGIKRAKLKGEVTPDADIDRNTSEVELSLLRDVLPYPCTDHDKVISLDRVARQQPESIRSYIHGHAITLTCSEQRL